MPFDNKGQPYSGDFFGKGVVVSFDLVTANLKKYYSEKSPQGAYEVIAKEFENHGFEKLKDSDYRNNAMSEFDALEMIKNFAQKEKWFPASVDKIIVSPNVPRLDISDTVKEVFADKDWINAKDKEYAEKQAIKEKESC